MKVSYSPPYEDYVNPKNNGLHIYQSHDAHRHRSADAKTGLYVIIINDAQVQGIHLSNFVPRHFRAYRARAIPLFTEREIRGAAGRGGWVIFHRKSNLSLTHVRVLQSIFPAQRERLRERTIIFAELQSACDIARAAQKGNVGAAGKKNLSRNKTRALAHPNLSSRVSKKFTRVKSSSRG